MRSTALLAAVLVALLLAAPAAPAQPTSPPDVSGAPSAIVVDGRNGEVMFEKRADDRRSIASTTKLMTALLALERARPNEVFTAPRYDALPIESQINLRTGERMKVNGQGNIINIRETRLQARGPTPRPLPARIGPLLAF